MNINFDAPVDRHGTGSIKYDLAAQMGYPADILSLWVADMDFPAPECVQTALRAAVAHGIYGYTEGGAGYFDAVQGWFSRHFGFTPEPEWLVKTPGVVFALAMAVRAFTAPGDRVLILSPVYYPFARVVENNGRVLVRSELQNRGGHYEIDFADMETKIAENDVKLLLFCSPHNPVGRVWTRKELSRLLAICRAHDVLVVSDEIHCDFVWPGHTHTMLPTMGEDALRRTILCTAPSKTFNLAGLQASNIFIADEALRKKFQQEVTSTGSGLISLPGLCACQAAYTGGDEWLAALKTYLWDNFRVLERELTARVPGVHMALPEGTYLGWIDCTGLGLGDALDTFMLRDAHLWLDQGALFGTGGAAFERINVACPRANLLLAVDRLASAAEHLS